jgi:hypothetical protein
VDRKDAKDASAKRVHMEGRRKGAESLLVSRLFSSPSPRLPVFSLFSSMDENCAP